MSITKKGKMGQFFCRHKNTGWYKRDSLFQTINGEMHFKICKKCGKKLGERFLKYEGMGFK